ncbi:ATP-binding cassette domain-containing protein [Luxibacter massiliensis]|uniref:ATP-binding cassette domain-containing protein n=1 Tax=Luxibacter massiliensis TaxID=2219695 RepID=UPI000F049476|nr:ABC transporter ATP-binding protein [Luxibacter massiliensis]
MLEVTNLSVHFEDRGIEQKVVKNISFTIQDGEILGIVGESGSGKTMTALAVAGLLKEQAMLDGGSIMLDGRELLNLSPREMREVQGQNIGMIFQEPMTALNPTMKIGKQVEEALLLHTGLGREERTRKALHALEDVELKEPEKLYDKYPHELSGGMRQRVMIASAMICRPGLLIADEPTTALDVHTQEEILCLLKKLNKKYKMSILFISHNLRVVNTLCRRILVMKDGEVVEQGEARQIFENPAVQYTKELIAAIPSRTKSSGFYRFLREKAGEGNA